MSLMVSQNKVLDLEDFISVADTVSKVKSMTRAYGGTKLYEAMDTMYYYCIGNGTTGHRVALIAMDGTGATTDNALSTSKVCLNC